MCSTQPPANSKDFYTPTRTNRTLTTEREFTGSPVSAVRCTSGKLNATSPPDWRNTEHTAAEEILRSPPSSSTHTSRTTKSTGRQPNSSHPSTHGTPDASERPSRSSNTTLCHRTSAFSSATFGDQYYRLKDLLYPKSTTHTRLRDRLYPKSTTLLPLCLLTTDSVQWAHTPLPNH